MAEHHPELVGSLVVSGSVLSLSELISINSLERIGFSSWPEFLLPHSVEGVKQLLKIGSYSLPCLPGFFYKHFLQIIFENRKEKVELLEALVVKDDDVTAIILNRRLGGETELQVVLKAGHLALLERPCAFKKDTRLSFYG